MLHCQHGAVSFANGRLGQARLAVEEAMRIASELGHPFNLAYASFWAALYEDTMGNWETSIRLARQAIDTARTYDFRFWEGLATIFCGHAIARMGNVAEGLALLRNGIERWRSTGAHLTTSLIYNLLADVCLAADDFIGAQAALRESEAHAKRSGEMVFIAETYRLKAECKRRAGVSREPIDALLRLAISTARQQGTKLWELRSTLDLHRLHASPDATAALEAICEAFDGEPAALDVSEARTRLDQPYGRSAHR
jgi:adenylate cyclase